MHEILLNNGSKRRRRSTPLSLAEMMTLVVFTSFAQAYKIPEMA
ncbi:hypothetical protein [Candidatus Arsenophonus triatominarum]|nr:hypothetical protein [Candidatus Arsenophonus triatominarum]